MFDGGEQRSVSDPIGKLCVRQLNATGRWTCTIEY